MPAGALHAALCTSNVRQAIETAAQDADRTAPVTEEHHQLVLDAEREFADAGSNDRREAHRALRGRPMSSDQASVMARRLPDRTRLREMVARRRQRSPSLVKRLVEWLRRRVEQLLRALRPGKPVEPDTERAVTPAAPTPRRTHRPPLPVPSIQDPDHR